MEAPTRTAERALGREHWLAVAIAAAAFLGLVAFRWILQPEAAGYGTHEQLGLPPCRAIEWFGVPCPGCGVTTSVAWFAHGELARSLSTQPFGFLLALGAVLALPVGLTWTLARRDFAALARALNTRRTWTIAATLLGAAWIYKIAVIVSS
jgi:hypothetical protein